MSFLTLLFKVGVVVFLCRDVKAQCALEDVIISDQPCDYNITATMTLYQDRNFSTLSQQPYQLINSNSFINLVVSLQSTTHVAPHNLLLIERCWATTTSDHVVGNQLNDFVNFPGCPASPYQSAIQLLGNGVDRQVRITFPPFFLLSNATSFFVHCTVGSCNNCLSDKCKTTFTGEPLFTRAAALLSLGPITRTYLIPVTEAPTATVILYTSPVLMVLTVILASIIIFMLALVVMYIVYPCYKRRESKKDERLGTSEPVLMKSTLNLADDFRPTYINTDLFKESEEDPEVETSLPDKEKPTDVYATVNKKNTPIPDPV